MDSSRFYAEVAAAHDRTQKLQKEAQTQQFLREVKPNFSLRAALAAQLRRAAEQLEPHPKPKGIS